MAVWTRPGDDRLFALSCEGELKTGDLGGGSDAAFLGNFMLFNKLWTLSVLELGRVRDGIAVPLYPSSSRFAAVAAEACSGDV